MMTVTAFLIILSICAAATSLITEGIKKLLDEAKVSYAANLLVFIVAIIVGCGATALYYVNYQVPFTALNSVYLALMGIQTGWVRLWDMTKCGRRSRRSVRRRADL